ncbi:MAG: PfkB family carbohydrate kinase [Armatimonadota bacterium]|nr:PfkB family carbohydrate kinase [Armatimonadota bacterium]
MSVAEYEQILQGFADLRVVVIGDLMLDEYVFGIVRRISPEAPVPVVEWTEESYVPGGAANVANNLLALGAQVSVFGVVGNDEKGRILTAHLAESGVDIAGVLVDDTRVTTCKTRVIAHSQQVVRLDREQRHPISQNLHQELLRRFEAVLSRANAVVISDYQKGVLTSAVTREVVERCLSAEVLVTANPKPPLLRHLRGTHLVSINLQEAQSFAHSAGDGTELHSLAQVSAFAQEWRQALGVGALVVTLGAEGMLLSTESDAEVHVPAMPVEVYDTAGAGDTVIATLTCALSAGADWLTAARLANAAAGSVVRHVGVVPPRREEILRLLAENPSGRLA